MTYETARSFVAAWGSIYFGVLFSAAVAYALWPSKQKAFEEASKIPLTED
jgi:cytochrome c oxidase cbb3-type subunit 4